MLDQKPSDNVSVRFDHAWVIPPSLFDDSDMDPQGTLYPLLRAFLTPDRTSELQTILKTNTLESRLKNLFLLSPSVHSAFRNGHIRIFPPTNTFDQWNDETEARIKTASQVYNSNADLVTRNSQLEHNYPEDITLTLAHLYPRSFTGLVQQLPFELYAKECTRSINEGQTLKLVERYTSIPASLWVDDYQGTHRVVIMTANSGQTLDTVFHRLSYSERKQLTKDLKSALSQLRSIPNHTPYRFGNSHGGPLFDYRFPSGICGSFHQISEFNSFLAHNHVLNETRDKVAAVYARTYRSVFTHADLNTSNILIDHGRLSGIVDWECAGFYPEYWEFTKLFYGAQPPPEIQSVILMLSRKIHIRRS
ncbi:hypothetical protein PENNAL_c0003G03888 [Penicillium nalgiovense]|uniref:Aminoglycoside phosphotransferase domain-containing protein n=1 Tax=Penicillium nalgiovense TaxID=60175 RepID=A0A1V6Z4Y1_PENNA|nr:hypothetical protein PENNAL_c0003G03888 [Penicillium nalgiovense]